MLREKREPRFAFDPDSKVRKGEITDEGQKTTDEGQEKLSLFLFVIM